MPFFRRVAPTILQCASYHKIRHSHMNAIHCSQHIIISLTSRCTSIIYILLLQTLYIKCSASIQHTIQNFNVFIIMSSRVCCGVVYTCLWHIYNISICVRRICTIYMLYIRIRGIHTQKPRHKHLHKHIELTL